MQPNGIISAIITPFSSDGESVNESELRAIVESGITSGLGGIVPCGGTGEFAAMSPDERRRVVEIVVEQAGKRTSVMAQVGANSTREAVAHAKHAAKVGADAIMLATPYYESIDFDGVRRYFHDVAAASDLPICIYNFPPAMGIRYDADRVRTLVGEISSIKFMKDSSGDFALLDSLINSGTGVQLFAGEDVLAFPAFLQGCAGVINGAANFLTPAFVKMLNASNDGQYEDVMTTWRKINPLISEVISGHYNGGVKAAVAALGFDVGPIRAPYNSLSQEKTERIQAIVKSMDPALLNTPKTAR
ncbi:MAG: dihydrodipicolinate synthase family protein [Shinella zoogloeoides]|uniref:dihydrodipicolinate synthase family protein n=1 Tax=Shinella zoogloeoides TaxID=352475 RepID=UPI003C7886EC